MVRSYYHPQQCKTKVTPRGVMLSWMMVGLLSLSLSVVVASSSSSSSSSPPPPPPQVESPSMNSSLDEVSSSSSSLATDTSTVNDSNGETSASSAVTSSSVTTKTATPEPTIPQRWMTNVQGLIQRSRTKLDVKKMISKPMKEITLSVPVATSVGILLALNSGYLNGCCLSGMILAPQYTKPQAVAAVTGGFTNSALGYAHPANFQHFQTQIYIVLSYLWGSCIAGIVNPYPKPFQLVPATGPSFLIGAGLLYLAYGHGAAIVAGTKSMDGTHDILLFFSLIAAVNGLQNSITSVHSSNMIRSTHYTGMTSDSGTFLGQLLRGNRSNLQRLYINVALAAAFWIGGYISLFATQSLSISCLLLSARFLLLLGIGILITQLI